MRALLDINVIIALLDSGHVMHRAASHWLAQHQEHGWATTPITENGVVRILSQPAYPNHRPAAQVAERLAEACGHASHQFWPEAVSLLEPGLIAWQRLLSPRQITDCYLLALAVAQGGHLVSFDQRVSVDLVRGARDGNLSLIEMPTLAA
jgi:toxin-antitoxin system PIN domain toxin